MKIATATVDWIEIRARQVAWLGLVLEDSFASACNLQLPARTRDADCL